MITGGTFFFTVVTYNRRMIFRTPDNIGLLRTIFKEVMAKHPFTIDAAVILPEHLHCIWTLPEGDRDFSMRWRLIKSDFTRRCDQVYKITPSAVRQYKKEQAIWQRRFWEHQIRDETDFIRHVEYIHYNPVKHGLVDSPKDLPYSSFQKYVKEGKYEIDWGEGKIDTNMEIGNE
jgi:putative transposase